MVARSKGYAVCVRNVGFAASLELRKLYPFIRDPDADARNLIRVANREKITFIPLDSSAS